AVGHHAHAPVAGHLADLEEPDRQPELGKKMPEIKAFGAKAVAGRQFGQAVAAEVGSDVAGEDAAEHVEAGLDLDAGLLALLDDLGRQPQPVLDPLLL